MITGSGRELRQILALSLPMMAGQGGVMLMSVVDVVIVGRVSSLEMAATALGNSFANVPLVLLIGLGMGIEPLVSQAFGAAQSKRAQRYLWQGVYLTTLFSLPMTVVLLLLVQIFLPAPTDHVLQARAQAFLWARAPGFWFCGFAVFRAYFACVGRPRAVLVAVILGNAVNGLAGCLLGLGWLGLPRLGCVGVGYANSLASASMAVFLAYVSWEKSVRLPRLAWTQIQEILKFGTPIGLQLAAEVGVFTFVTAMISTLGPMQLAAHQVALTTAALAYMLVLGIANATTARVGFHIGAGNSEEARRSGRVAIATGATFMALWGLGCILLRGFIARALSPTDLAAQSVSRVLLVVGALFAVVDGVQAVAGGALRGRGDTKWPFFITLIGHWFIGLPIGVFLSQSLGSVGYWIGLSVGLTVVAVAFAVRF